MAGIQANCGARGRFSPLQNHLPKLLVSKRLTRDSPGTIRRVPAERFDCRGPGKTFVLYSAHKSGTSRDLAVGESKQPASRPT